MLGGAYAKLITSRSKTFLAFCFSFMLGAASFSFFDTSYFLYPCFVAFFITSFLAIVCWRRVSARFIFLVIIFFILGAIRFLVTFPAKSPEYLRYFNGRPVVVTGYVSAEPDVRIGETQYVVAAEKITENSADHTVVGKMLVKNRSYPAFQYGDKLRIKCLLEAPFVADDGAFRYDKYLARQDIWSVCSHPIISAESGGDGNVALRYILSFKAQVGDQLAKLWTEPEASFMAGLLYGSKSGLPSELTTNFSRTGVTHIIAVSGFNITIIGTVLASLFMIGGLSRRRAFWFILGIIFLFVIFTGASSSVVRAGIMGSLVLIARQLGRLSRISNVLVLTAASMTLLNPYVLVWDVGFQLSFLATLGLVYISPLLETALPTLVKPAVLAGLYETFIATLSAITATLPLILFQFGRLSTVAPLVNVLVLWCIPWLMLFGFVSLIISFLYFPLGQIVAWVASVGLKYVILVVTFFGSKSWSSLDFALPWWGMVGLYVALFIVIARSEARATAKKF